MKFNMKIEARFLTVSKDVCSFCFKKNKMVISPLLPTLCLCRSVLCVAQEVERVIH